MSKLEEIVMHGINGTPYVIGAIELYSMSNKDAVEVIEFLTAYYGIDMGKTKLNLVDVLNDIEIEHRFGIYALFKDIPKIDLDNFDCNVHTLSQLPVPHLFQIIKHLPGVNCTVDEVLLNRNTLKSYLHHKLLVASPRVSENLMTEYTSTRNSPYDYAGELSNKVTEVSENNTRINNTPPEVNDSSIVIDDKVTAWTTGSGVYLEHKPNVSDNLNVFQVIIAKACTNGDILNGSRVQTDEQVTIKMASILISVGVSKLTCNASLLSDDVHEMLKSNGILVIFDYVEQVIMTDKSDVITTQSSFTDGLFDISPTGAYPKNSAMFNVSNCKSVETPIVDAEDSFQSILISLTNCGDIVRTKSNVSDSEERNLRYAVSNNFILFSELDSFLYDIEFTDDALLLANRLELLTSTLAEISDNITVYMEELPSSYVLKYLAGNGVVKIVFKRGDISDIRETLKVKTTDDAEYVKFFNRVMSTDDLDEIYIIGIDDVHMKMYAIEHILPDNQCNIGDWEEFKKFSTLNIDSGVMVLFIESLPKIDIVMYLISIGFTTFVINESYKIVTEEDAKRINSTGVDIYKM